MSDVEEMNENGLEDEAVALSRFDIDTGLLRAAVPQDTEQHALATAFGFWAVKRNHGPRTQENYERSIRRIAIVSSVEEFWGIYNFLLRPDDTALNGMDLHLFRDGVKPMWEDPANKSGGKFTVRLRKGLASRYWEDLLLVTIGEAFGVGNELCGVGVSKRYNEDILTIWNANANDEEAKKRIYDTLQSVLPLSQAQNAMLEYKAHDQAIQSANLRRRQQRLAQKKAEKKAKSEAKQLEKAKSDK